MRQVYAVTLYVEADRAAKELGIRSRGGFFSSDDDFALAVSDGAFGKVLQVQLVRKVDGPQFYQVSAYLSLLALLLPSFLTSPASSIAVQSPA